MLQNTEAPSQVVVGEMLPPVQCELLIVVVSVLSQAPGLGTRSGSYSLPRAAQAVGSDSGIMRFFLDQGEPVSAALTSPQENTHIVFKSIILKKKRFKNL